MLYKLSELAEELGIAEQTLQAWLDAGAPYQEDPQGCTWVNGMDFAMWVSEQRKPNATQRLENDEAYCLHCRKAVKLVDPKVRPIKGKLIHITGKCPACGHMIVRGGRSY